MNTVNIVATQNIVNDGQFINAKGRPMSETYFIHSLIREYAKHEADGYVLSAKDLSFTDQKLFLSYLLSADTYEDALSNDMRTRQYIAEELPEMQLMIDRELDSVYHEDMKEMELCLTQKSNGDVMWSRK